MAKQEWIGKEEQQLTVVLHPRKSDEFYILESLEMFCDENNFTQQEGLLEILRMGVEEAYGMQRRSNNPIFHEKEYEKEKKKILEKGGRINYYELNKLKRNFVEERNDFR